MTTIAPPDAVDSPPKRTNPYVGPEPSASASTCTDRAREIGELCDLLIAERVVLLYSPSGAGKSSTLEAGLRPELATHAFSVLRRFG